MAVYKVRSGQNIFDIALTLHGSVEGVFDLLSSNSWLTMETKLSQGMELNYHTEFIVNPGIVLWLRENGIIVRNGEHIHGNLDIEELVQRHFEESHPKLYEEIAVMSPDEQDLFWETLYTPKIVIKQQGQLSTLRLQLKPEKHLIIDWGDYSEPQIIEGGELTLVEHCYKGLGNHTITFYGDFEFAYLNVKEINGVYYPLSRIIADRFETELKIEDLNKLIITQ